MRSDGLIIQPSRPATNVDAMILPAALRPAGARPAPSGKVWATHAAVRALWRPDLSLSPGAPRCAARTMTAPRSASARQVGGLVWHYALAIDVGQLV